MNRLTRRYVTYALYLTRNMQPSTHKFSNCQIVIVPKNPTAHILLLLYQYWKWMFHANVHRLQNTKYLNFRRLCSNATIKGFINPLSASIALANQLTRFYMS